MNEMKEEKQGNSYTINNIDKVGNFNPNAKVVNDTVIIHVTVNVNVNFGGKKLSNMLHNAFANVPSSIKSLIRAHLLGIGAVSAVPCIFAAQPVVLIGVLEALALLFKDENALSIKYISKFLQIEQDNLSVQQAIEIARYESEQQEKQK